MSATPGCSPTRSIATAIPFLPCAWAEPSCLVTIAGADGSPSPSPREEATTCGCGSTHSCLEGCYLQELVEGIAGSIVFVAAAGVAVPLGVSRQLFGDPAFGAVKYQYCGSILAPAADACFDDDARLVERAAALTRVVAEEFDVVGVNGVDFVARGGIPYPIEVNPRWSASMDLVERQYNLSVFGVHAAACQGQHLPEFDLRCERSRAGAIGKAVIFARHDAIVGDTSEWLSNAEIRDVPRTGEYIRATRPVCTVYARDRDAVRCYAELVARAESVYARLALWRTPVNPV